MAQTTTCPPVPETALGQLDGPRRCLLGLLPEMVEAALRARRLLRSLAERRRELGLSQTTVAARMKTSQSALARLEGGEADPRISTVERYALAMGEELEHRRTANRKTSRKTRA